MPRYSEPFLLSTRGSVRATSYGFSNKSVTLNGKTHVVWLDRPATVCGRTFDHASKSWSPTLELFEGSDNHTSPALIADGFGDPHLRLMIGPHGAGWNDGRFKWVISEEPGRIDKWKWECNAGYLATYPSIVHTPQGIDAIVYRGGEWPPSLMFQKQRSMRHWTKARELFWQDIGWSYTHYGAFIVCDAKGTLYVAAHFYRAPNTGNLDDPENRYLGVGIIKSTDAGDTWTNMAGEAMKIPLQYDDRFGVPPLGEKKYALGGLAIDSRGTVWVIATDTRARERGVYVSRWTGSGWQTHDAGVFLPPERMAVDTMFTIDSKDRLHLAVTALRPDKLKNGSTLTVWGHPSCEVFHMMSSDGGKGYSCQQISVTDETKPSWLPNITLNTAVKPVENPVILYTHGEPGMVTPPGATKPEEAMTEVWCVTVDPDD